MAPQAKWVHSSRRRRYNAAHSSPNPPKADPLTPLEQDDSATYGSYGLYGTSTYAPTLYQPHYSSYYPSLQSHPTLAYHLPQGISAASTSSSSISSTPSPGALPNGAVMLFPASSE